MATKISKNVPISSLPEDDYCLGKASQITLRPLFENGLYEEYNWFRDYFIQYSKTVKNKPYHSHFFSVFQHAVFKTDYADNRVRRRILNFYKAMVQANINITAILQDDTAKVVFAKPVISFKENAPVIKSLKGTEIIVKAFVSSVAMDLPRPLLNVGCGAVNHIPDSESYDLLDNKNINHITQESLSVSSFVSNQSIYHIQPNILDQMCKRPFLGSYTLKREYLNMTEDFVVKSGLIGSRSFYGEFFYHPRFFIKRGFLVYSPAHLNKGDYLCFIFSNHLKPPKNIPFKASVEVDVEPYSVLPKEKVPLMHDVRACDTTSLSLTTFYHSQKMDGILAKLKNEGGSLTLHARHGFKYRVLNVASSSVSDEYYVEVILDEEKMKAKIFFIMKKRGSYLWEDISSFGSSYPMFGNKSYYLVPNFKIYSFKFDDCPSDGLVYVPALSYTGDIYGEREPFSMCSHYFLKPLPTYDVPYTVIRELISSGKNVVFKDDKKTIMKDKEYYQAHGEFMDQNPFIYEVSVKNDLAGLVYYVHHTRLDKKKVQVAVPKNLVLERGNEKGVFYFSKLGENYDDASNKFLNSFNPNRRFISPSLLSNKEDFFFSVLKELCNGSDALKISATDLYKKLMLKYSSYMAMLFVHMSIKSTKVGKFYKLKNCKISCELIFTQEVEDTYDLDILFGERKFRLPSRPLK